jgi:hypothetical protein
LSTESPSFLTLLTLMLHTYVEEKRARVSQTWLRTGSDRSRRTFIVREGLSEASTVADGLLSRERSGFYRRRYGH